MKNPSEAALKALFALSGNRCAFPGCKEAMVDSEGRVKGDACHIKGERPSSKRYDKRQPDRERHGFHNLIAMCRVHHKNEIDSPEWKAKGYSIEWLLTLKQMHEKAMGGKELDPAGIRIEVAGDVVMSHRQHGGITAGTVHIHGKEDGGLIGEPSQDALHVLFRAANPTAVRDQSEKGKIKISMSGETFCYSIGGVQYFTFKDHAQQARMNDCLQELQDRKLLSITVGKQFELSHKGYEKAQSLKWESNELWWKSLATCSSGDSLT